jgi:BASS family bile acid:Na+ symporter
MNTVSPAKAAKAQRSPLMSFVRTYLLFIAIATGGLVFCLFHFIPALAPLKPAAYFFGSDMLPVFIFSMLYLSFCKVNLKEMKPRRWHLIVYATMFAMSAAIAVYLGSHQDSPYKVLLEGALICVIFPPAAAAGVIGDRIGGNESSIVTGVLIGNVLTSVSIPLLFPLFTTALHGSFFEEFLTIAAKVFPVVVLPLILAFATKAFLKRVHHFIITKLHDLSFYLWGITLATIAGRSFDCLVNSPEPASTLWALALIGLATTAFNFAYGKFVGNSEGQRISAGQAFGQRNGVFGLWVSFAYLEPAAVIAPGCYILWQNLVNAWQMAYREKIVSRCKKSGTTPYHE